MITGDQDTTREQTSVFFHQTVNQFLFTSVILFRQRLSIYPEYDLFSVICSLPALKAQVYQSF